MAENTYSAVVGAAALGLVQTLSQRSAAVQQRTVTFKDADGRDCVATFLERPAEPGAPPVPAVLLLHGFSSRAENMTSLVPSKRIPRGARVVLLDLPGHGRHSSYVGPAFTGISTAELILWLDVRLIATFFLFLRSLSFGDFAVISHSFVDVLQF